MVKLFSWSIAIIIGIIIISTISLTYFAEQFILKLTNISLIFLFISIVGLIISLIFERIKDKKEEKDDISKY